MSGTRNPSSTMIVHTARIWYRGDDRLDCTRATGIGLGQKFAPSRRLLDWYKDASKRAVLRHDIDAARQAWDEYEVRYTDEIMTVPISDWSRLLGLDSATLVCYCPAATRCHRRLLAVALASRGAEYRGERETDE